MTGDTDALLAQEQAVLQAASEWVARAFGLAPGTVPHWRLVELIGAIRKAPEAAAAEIMQFALEERSAGQPPLPFLADMREDAAWWADCATPAEVEAVVAAGLRRVERAMFAQAARKRILVAMWDSLPDADRRTFLRRVDPDGKFRRAA